MHDGNGCFVTDSAVTAPSEKYGAQLRAPVDLRSDTITRPSAAMREAMASAEVGDEQRGEDPTVTRLEQMAASFLGQEAAVFMPTATMANQVAVRLLAAPGR